MNLEEITDEYILDKCKECPYFSPCLSNMGWCDKTGGKIQIFGSCTDYPEEEVREYHSNKKRRNKRERDARHQKKLKKIYENDHRWCPTPVIAVDKYRKKWCNKEDAVHYIRNYRSNHTDINGLSKSRYYKRVANKKVRRYQGRISNGSEYKKIYDYWWEMF